MFCVEMTKKKVKKEGMTDKLTTLPDEIWEALSRDAIRCKRSVTKQIEAILASYFDVENIEVNVIAVKHAQSKTDFPAGFHLKAIENGKKETPAQLIKGKSPVGEQLNFSGETTSRKRKNNEDAINELIDAKIVEKKNKQ